MLGRVLKDTQEQNHLENSMYKYHVITLKIPEYDLTQKEAEKLMDVFVTLLEIGGIEVVGEITYEEMKDEENE